MDLTLKRDWWSAVQMGIVCMALGLMGAIIIGAI